MSKESASGLAIVLAISILMVTVILMMVFIHIAKGLSLTEIEKSPILAILLFIAGFVSVYSYIMYIKTAVKIIKDS